MAREGSYKTLKEAVIRLSDRDMYLLFSKAERYIGAWEARTLDALLKQIAETEALEALEEENYG